MLRPLSYLALAVYVVTLGSGSSFAADPVVVVTLGKYNKQLLEQQWALCHNGICPGCLADMFPNPGINPFVDEDSPECEAIDWAMTPGGGFYRLQSLVTGSPWVGYALLFTSKNTLETTIASCKQRYSTDTHCEFWDGLQMNAVSGAYLVGDELSIPLLDLFINRAEVGEPPPNTSPYDFADLFDYTFAVYGELGPTKALESPWWTTFAACLLYYADASSVGPPAITGGGGPQRALDGQFALKCLAHALVCWQSPQWENGQAELDIIGPAGIEPFAWDPQDTPTFAYWMAEALRGILGPRVATEQSTWGAVKNQYSVERN